MHPALNTRLTEIFGIRYPVIQTAMGWIATPELVAASSNAGAFGFLAGAVMKPAELGEAIARLKDLTPHNFGVNFHSFQPGAQEVVEVILANADRVHRIASLEQAYLASLFVQPCVGANALDQAQVRQRHVAHVDDLDTAAGGRPDRRR